MLHHPGNPPGCQRVISHHPNPTRHIKLVKLNKNEYLVNYQLVLRLV